MTHRVILWTTGHVGRLAGRAIAARSDMRIVGCYAHSPHKVGRDAGELLGLAPLGVAATNDVEALLALGADVVAYYPIVHPHEIPTHVATLERFLERGVNVVSTANLVTGRWWGAEQAFAAAGRRGNASLFAAGVNPGYVHVLTLTAASVCAEVERVSIWEEAECSGYDSAELWETVAFGHPPDEPDLEARFRHRTAFFEDAVAMMADALALALDEIRYVPELAVARRDLELGFMTLRRGTIAGLKNRWLGIAGGREVIELGTIWKMTEEVEPNWPVRHGWHIEVTGRPTVRAHVAGWPAGDESGSEALMGVAMLMTAMPTVHAIPHVVAARPGVVTYKDLPLVTAAGAVRV